MKKKRRLMLAVVLIGVAVVGLAAWGNARPAVASPERAQSEGKSFHARNDAADKLHRRTGEHGFSRSEGRDEGSDDREPDDRGDSATPTGGLTTTTTAGAATTPGGLTTTTTAGATTTTTQAPATTTTTAIDAATLFSTLCRSCHGPVQITSTQTATILTKITSGSMSGYASSLNSAQKTALANYVAGGGR